MTKESLLAQLASHDQQHLLDHWDNLDEAGRARLAEQIGRIDFELIDRLAKTEQTATDWAALAAQADPPVAFRLDDPHKAFSASEAREAGEAELRAGRVAAVLVAGGQGTRLGFSPPKGMYPLGPVSGRTLFQILIDQLLAVGSRYAHSVPLYLMTSPATHQETLEYFDQHNRLGLAADQLTIFCQGTMPAVDSTSGKLLLSAPDQLALSPDGHGGTLAALAECGALAEMQAAGIRHVYYFQVDNPLVQVCDPTLLGYHALSGSELSTQAIAKNDPLERVGNVVMLNGQMRIIEYIHLPDDVAQQRDEQGELRLWAGNMAVHVFDLPFLQRMAQQPDRLPLNKAHKKVPHVAPGGQEIEPTRENAYKFERFIFDLLPHARHPTVMEVAREEAFGPVKNADGPGQRDTPALARQAMSDLHRRWLAAAGRELPAETWVEINPRYAASAAELARRLQTHPPSPELWQQPRIYLEPV